MYYVCHIIYIYIHVLYTCVIYHISSICICVHIYIYIYTYIHTYPDGTAGTPRPESLGM